MSLRVGNGEGPDWTIRLCRLGTFAVNIVLETISYLSFRFYDMFSSLFITDFLKRGSVDNIRIELILQTCQLIHNDT